MTRLSHFASFVSHTKTSVSLLNYSRVVLFVTVPKSHSSLSTPAAWLWVPCSATLVVALRPAGAPRGGGWARVRAGAILCVRALPPAPDGRNLVDPASSHTLVSKIKPCMSKYKHYTVKLRMAHYISYSLFDSPYYLDNRSNSRANTCVKSHPGCIY